MTEWEGLKLVTLGGVEYLPKQKLLDIVANRAKLMLKELARPQQSITQYDLLRGAYAELQQIEMVLDERRDSNR